MESIAPDSTRIRRFFPLLAGLAILGAATTLVALIIPDSSSRHARALATGLILLVMGGAGAAYMQLFLANARLLVGGDVFGFQDAFGRRHTWLASEVGSVIDVSIVYSRKQIPQRVIYVLGLDGRRLCLVNPNAWSSLAIDRLVRATGKSLDYRAEPVPAADFRREFPQLIGWWGQHSSLMGGLIAIVALILALGIPIAMFWVHP